MTLIADKVVLVFIGQLQALQCDWFEQKKYRKQQRLQKSCHHPHYDIGTTNHLTRLVALQHLHQLQ